MWCVIQYRCHGSVKDDADRPDEYVTAVYGPFATEQQARAWFTPKCPQYTDRHWCGPYVSDYIRYEAHPLCPT